MKVSFECGNVDFEIDGEALYANGEWIADFVDGEYAEIFARTLTAYGDAMYAEGYIAAGMEAL